MRRKLKELSISLDKVANDGDLTIDLHFAGNNELSEISRSIQHMIEAFRDLVAGLSRSVSTSSKLNASLNTISEKVLDDAEITQKMATNITAAVEEMSATSEEIAKSASSTLEASDQLYSDTGRSIQFNEDNSQAMQKLADAMTGVEQRALKMEHQVDAISSILDTINQLADQTNLLALNAAIEAARAGEAGRGFAVVADEVRTLAKGSKDSSSRIAKLLDELQSASIRVVDGVKDNVVTAKQTLQKSEDARRISVELQKQAKTVEELSMQVATAAEQQSVTARHIAGDTNKVLEAADDELEATQEMKKMFDDLSLNGQTLQRTMKHFKIE